MKSPGTFITVHGIDGTGKTTLVEELVTRLHGRAVNYSDLPREGVAPPEGLVNETDEATLRLLSSLGKKVADSVRVRRYTDAGTVVVKDRWLIDVLADNLFRGVSAKDESLDSIAIPDLSVVLRCDEAVRMRRVSQRPFPTDDDLVPVAPGTRAEFFQDYLCSNVERFSRNYMILDSTRLPADVLARSVAECVGELADG